MCDVKRQSHSNCDGRFFFFSWVHRIACTLECCFRQINSVNTHGYVEFGTVKPPKSRRFSWNCAGQVYGNRFRTPKCIHYLVNSVDQRLCYWEGRLYNNVRLYNPPRIRVEEIWGSERDGKNNNHNLFIGVEHISMGCFFFSIYAVSSICFFLRCVYSCRCTLVPWHTVPMCLCMLCICFVCLFAFFFVKHNIVRRSHLASHISSSMYDIL